MAIKAARYVLPDPGGNVATVMRYSDATIRAVA